MRVLGISAEHDGGVALLENGRLTWAANEERYSRVKFQTGWPELALARLDEELNNRGINWPEMIAVASKFHIENNLGHWQEMSPQYEILERIFSVTRLDRLLWGSEWGARTLSYLGRLQQMARQRQISDILARFGQKKPQVIFVDHHAAHAAGAYYSSGWEKCLVITQDASGDGYCSKVFVGEAGKLTQVHAVPFFHSPGHYYEYVTMMFGFKLGREGKVTGLAAYGDPDKTFPVFWRECSYNRWRNSYINHALYRKAELRRLQRLLQGFTREDIAAGVQKHLEVIMTSYITDLISRFGGAKKVRLAVAGGVFANVRLNQKVAQLPGVASLWIYPHMGDGGLAAGAAWWVAGQSSDIKSEKMSNVYLGDDAPGSGPAMRVSHDSLQFDREMKSTSPYQIYRSEVETHHEKPSRMSPKQEIITKYNYLAYRVAKLLSRGKVVAIVQGAMEYGPRALGHRSLLVAATDKTVNDWLNRRLKRSEFMPFAPILKKEDVARYFTGWRKAAPSLPFMTVTVDCNDRCKKEAPAIVHVDGTARPQLVDKKITPFIYEILTEYRKLTGLRILINTSYNIHEQPIVRTAEEAMQTFRDGNIDALVINDRLISRRPLKTKL